MRKKCASLNKYDQDVQITSLQDLVPIQRFKSIVGMKGVKGSRQLLVVKNGDDPPPSTEKSARGGRLYRMIPFYCTLGKLRIAKMCYFNYLPNWLRWKLIQLLFPTFSAYPVACLKPFYQECHNLILASNINVRSNYDSTFSSTQVTVV